MTLFRTPIELGTLFEDLAGRGSATTVHLSRPMDIAPGLGTELALPRLARLAAEASGWLASAGTRPGDRVAIAKRNHWDYVVLSCAAARIGAVPVSLSAHLAPDTLAVLLKRLDPALLVTDAALLAAGREAGADPSALAARTVLVDGTAEGVLGLDDVRGGAIPAPRRAAPDAPLAIMHTSGTTGVPKLVVHSSRTIMRRLAGFEAHRWPVLGSRPDDTVAGAVSFAHGRALAWTASVLWLEPARLLAVTSGDWAEAGPFLLRHRPTTLEALPATYVRWQRRTQEPGHPFERVRLFISTFDAMHPPTVRAFLNGTRHRRPVWMQGWGQSETGPLTFRFLTRRAMAPEHGRHPTTRDLGRPVPTRTRLRVVDARTLRPVPRGTPGLVLCRTKALCLGYVGEQERWRAKRTGGWWNTGDIGVLTRTGRLLFVDRELDAIPEGSCVELEDVIDDRVPEVQECVVLSVPGRPSQPVVVTEDGALDPAAWRRAVADLPPLADPVVTTWDTLPRTGTGKVRRTVLRDLLGHRSDPYGTGRWT
ncbi:class I adenylate-forming enzyme family protein [Allonocardiopsis opalescens]|uniref:Acyl-CoA synthetase (AMP-forming)/AMP-acid ligase II n=1 Tax=Allonocardiopsis opalescens TaxID=1144618 RepID=A0A2T0QEL7_9ACTN|nr:class I adenylate-forming enzyme family protein [Allonocardiopsis opalescens]PRY02386.1 acyl-CoA synthetase (AMP-forming)/AMP-acid ligase II [Allonocardiopsis opalescens]